MEYQATARYQGKTYTGHIFNTDAQAVESVVGMLPGSVHAPDVALIVEHVYSNTNHVAYVTTLTKYRIETE
jgi:hypothetical protein